MLQQRLIENELDPKLFNALFVDSQAEGLSLQSSPKTILFMSRCCIHQLQVLLKDKNCSNFFLSAVKQKHLKVNHRCFRGTNCEPAVCVEYTLWIDGEPVASDDYQ